jgi:acyl carrier protein
LEEKIKKVISSVLKIPAESITDDTALKTCKQWTSKKHIMIIVALEQEFSIDGQITVDEIIQMVNVAKIKEILARHLH